MLAPLSFLLQQKRIPSSYLLLMQPGSGVPFTVPYTSPGTSASRAASSRALPTLQWHCAPLAVYPAAFYNVISTKSHPTTFPDQRLCLLDTSSNSLAAILSFTCSVLQTQLQVTPLLQQAGEILCIWGKGSPWTWLLWRKVPCRGDRKPQATADPRVSARKGIRMEQASHEVQAQGRKADIVSEAPLLHSELNIKQHLPPHCPQGHTGQLPLPRAAAGALHHHPGSGSRQQTPAEDGGALSRLEEYVFPLW